MKIKNHKGFLGSLTLCILFLGISLPILSLEKNQPHFAEFSIAIEQNGELVEIRDHKVELKKEPFVLIVYFQKPNGVMVNASFDKIMFNKALEDQIIETGGRAMADDLKNPRQSLILSEESFNYLMYEDQETHRFDSVKVTDKTTVCRKTISNVELQKVEGQVKIQDMEASSLYLVFIKSEWTKNNETLEKQRYYLEAIFK